MATSDKAVALVKLEPQDLLRLAVENKADISTLERLVALAKDVRAEQAKEEWQRAMSAFQADCPPIKKTADAEITTRSGGKYKYTYAPLDQILVVARPVLAKHGLTATWRHPAAPAGHIAAVCRIAHTLGHFEESESVVLPITQRSEQDTGGANPAQRVGMALTYSKRYAFLAISGLTPEAEDDDSGGHHEDEGPARTPAAEDGSVLIVDVKELTGNKKSGKGTWTKWQVTFDDGQVGGTFTRQLAEECRKLQAAGSRVIPVLEQDGNFTNLVDLKFSDDQRVQDHPVHEEDNPNREFIEGAVKRDALKHKLTATEAAALEAHYLKNKKINTAAYADLHELYLFLGDEEAVKAWRAEVAKKGEQVEAPF